MRAGHPFSASIKAKDSDLASLWSSVNEACTDREQALLGAKQVHRFDHSADETLSWLQDVEAAQIVLELDDLSQASLPAIKVGHAHASVNRSDVCNVCSCNKN